MSLKSGYRYGEKKNIRDKSMGSQMLKGCVETGKGLSGQGSWRKTVFPFTDSKYFEGS